MNQNPNLATNAPTPAAAAPSLAKEKYRSLKRKFKFLVYENECYQEELRNLQRRLLKLSRDKNFLLDRLMQYEKVSDSSDDSDPQTPAVQNTSESPKPKKPKKSYPSAKKSRAKQPPTQANVGEMGTPSSAPLSTPATGAGMIRGRPRKGNANGTGSSSDPEAVASTSSSTGIVGPAMEMERMPSHVVTQYPAMGVYEQQLPPPPVLPNEQNT